VDNFWKKAGFVAVPLRLFALWYHSGYI